MREPMKVRDLIAELQKLDQDLPITVLDKVDYEDVGWVPARQVRVERACPYTGRNTYTAAGSTTTEYVDQQTMEVGRKYGPRPEDYRPMTPVVKISPRTS